MKPCQRFIPGLAVCGIAMLQAGCASNDRFSKLDTNQDRSGSPAEFDAFMKQEVFTRIDTTGDGRISKSEWQQFNPEVSDAKFRKADLGGDGFINRKEADAAFDREGSLGKLFTAIDADGNGNLSRAEARAFRAKVEQQPGTSASGKTSNAIQTL